MLTEVKWLLLIATANGALAVMLGAFGAHGLKGSLSESMLAAWQTGVQYHFYHTFVLLAVGLLIQQGFLGNTALIAGGLFIVGIVFFCGSLYGLALGGPRWLGPVTPLGGLMFIAGWISLFVSILKAKS